LMGDGEREAERCVAVLEVVAAHAVKLWEVATRTLVAAPCLTVAVVAIAETRSRQCRHRPRWASASARLRSSSTPNSSPRSS
jgi:hypothetical protein